MGSLPLNISPSYLSHFMNGMKTQLRLCSLFQEDGRFITFVNRTGRPVILSSKSWKDGRYFWSAGILINVNCSFTWRFIGNFSSMFEDYFLLLPESYDAARTSELQFLAEYLGDDAGEDMEITFNEEIGPLKLVSMRYLTNRESATVILKRRDKSLPRVVDIIQDRLARGEIITEDIPLTLARNIQHLRRKLETIENNLLSPCQHCHQIHIYNVRQSKMENYF